MNKWKENWLENDYFLSPENVPRAQRQFTQIGGSEADSAVDRRKFGGRVAALGGRKCRGAGNACFGMKLVICLSNSCLAQF